MVQDTRTALLSAAHDLVQRVGINAMSYNDLSREVGIRKASIHYHFPKKEDMILALQQECHITYGDNYQRVAGSSGTAVEKLRQICEIYVETARQGKLCLVAMLSAEHESLSQELRNQLVASIENTVDIFESIFVLGVGKGEIVVHGTPRKAAHAYLSMLMGGQVLARCTGRPDDLTKSAEQFIHGLIVRES